MNAYIRLSRRGAANFPGRHSWVLGVQAVGVGMPSDVFVFQVAKGNAAATFSCVASVAQLSEIPTQPLQEVDLERQVPFFRRSYVELNCRSKEEEALVWAKIQLHVAALVRNFQSNEALRLVEDVQINVGGITSVPSVERRLAYTLMALPMGIPDNRTAGIPDNARIVTPGNYRIVNTTGTSGYRVASQGVDNYDQWLHEFELPVVLDNYYQTLGDTWDTGHLVPLADAAYPMAGWIPASVARTCGMSPPARAKFFYNYNADKKLARLLPLAQPFNQHTLELNGRILQYGAVYSITASGLWWLDFAPKSLPSFEFSGNAPWPVDYVDLNNPGAGSRNLILRISL